VTLQYSFMSQAPAFSRNISTQTCRQCTPFQLVRPERTIRTAMICSTSCAQNVDQRPVIGEFGIVDYAFVRYSCYAQGWYVIALRIAMISR